jgi:endogenous inhibitor of DNA gyrase (YacG/DUF329 family)
MSLDERVLGKSPDLKACPIMEAMVCPSCGKEMAIGWIAMWNPFMGQKVRWQPTEPGWVRLRVPSGAAVVLQARAGGKDARVSWRCTECQTTVIPADPSYDKA